MLPKDLAIGITFVAQLFTGTLGNIILLFHYFSLCFTGYKLKPTDLIAKHLTLANTVIMLSKGVSQTMEAFRVMYFSQLLKCTLLLYVYRVGKGVSVSTTCLLSVFQTLTISPMKSSWTEHKVKLSKHIDFSLFLSWILCMLIHCIFPLYAISIYSSKNMSEVKDFAYYCSDFADKITEVLYSAFVLFPEFLCSGLMIWSSCSMIFILHRHKKQVQYINRTNFSQKLSPETRATQSILVLMCTFVSMYTLSSFFYGCIINFYIPSSWFLNICALISTSFPTVSPFILMRCNSTASRLWHKFSWFSESHKMNC